MTEGSTERWEWGKSCDLLTILTSEPRVHDAIIALHGTAGLFRFLQTCPPWRDIDSSTVLCPWHPYRTMCCRKSRLRAESKIGSYYTLNEMNKSVNDLRPRRSPITAPSRCAGARANYISQIVCAFVCADVLSACPSTSFNYVTMSISWHGQ